MDPQFLVNTTFGIVLAGFGWFARELWGAVKELRKQLHRLEVDLPKSYLCKDDFDKRMDHIEDMFQRIYAKIDGKADR